VTVLQCHETEVALAGCVNGGSCVAALLNGERIPSCEFVALSICCRMYLKRPAKLQLLENVVLCSYITAHSILVLLYTLLPLINNWCGVVDICYCIWATWFSNARNTVRLASDCFLAVNSLRVVIKAGFFPIQIVLLLQIFPCIFVFSLKTQKPVSVVCHQLK